MTDNPARAITIPVVSETSVPAVEVNGTLATPAGEGHGIATIQGNTAIFRPMARPPIVE